MSVNKIILTNERPLPEPSKDGSVRWTTDKFEATHMVLNGIYYVKGPSGNWFAPDYTQPGTAEAVKADVDETVAEHWSIDRWRK
jgi:hypothetical protein